MVRALALLLTVVTGFSGLVYEVAWQKYLATLLGSHGEATAAVLAIFLGGLSLGYAGFGRLTRSVVARATRDGRSPRLLLGYGIVEASIGIYALAFPWLFAAAQAVSSRLPGGADAFAFGLDVLLAAALIGPPSALMGGTIPILTQALSRGLDDATRFHALVYALNTVGAFAGALAAGFWLVPALGLVGVVRTVGWLNVLAGASFALLQRFSQPVEAPAPAEAAPRVGGLGAYALVALLVGFAMMAVQVVFIRIGGLSLGSSHFTFAMIVAVFVLCIALGSLAVSALERIRSGVIVASLWLLLGLLIALYSVLDDAPYWAHVLRSLFRDHPAGFGLFYANVFVALLVVIGAPVLLSGAALPLLFHHLRREVGDLGAVAGRLYAWNTVGSLLGALLGGYLLLFWLDLHQVYRLAAAAIAVAACWLSLRILGRVGRTAAVATAAAALVVLAMLPAWSPKQLSAGLFRQRRPQATTYTGPRVFFDAARDSEVVFYDDDPTASVAVVDHATDDGGRSLAIVTNGKPDGSIAIDYTTMGLAALVPAVLTAARAERAFVIGYGTGVTVGELAALDSMQEIVVAEISSGVMDAAPWFDESNLSASSSDKLTVLRSDAYRALQRSRGTFDVIVSEPSNPWVTGVEMLYSREFLAAARDRLSPGGVYLQWCHTYESDHATLALILATYTDVFDDVAVWYGMGHDIYLMGFATGSAPTDLSEMIRRARRPDVAAGLSRSGVDSVPELLAHELIPRGVLTTVDFEGPVHTLLHPILSDRAARAFFRGGEARLPRTSDLEAARVGARTSLVRQLAARTGGRLPPSARASFVAEICAHRSRECSVALAHWRREEPVSAARRSIEADVRHDPELRGALDAKTLKTLALLFASPAEIGENVGVHAVRGAGSAFQRYFFHSLPFERASLRELFRACERQPRQAEQCRKFRTRIEERLGDLELDVDPVSVVGSRRD